jgi:hypothetical protein
MAEPRIRFRDLPLAVRLAVMLVYFMAWVLFAEFGIDSYGLDEHLPFYRVGDLCPYELVVLGILGFAWWRAHRR